MEWYLKVWKDYADFNGRARRKEYWMFALINTIIVLALYSIAIAGIANDSGVLATLGMALYGMYALAVLIPSLAVAVRRLHDVGKSGWFLLIALIPIIGGIWLLVLLCTDSVAGENEYGPNPKTGSDTTEHLVDTQTA